MVEQLQPNCDFKKQCWHADIGRYLRYVTQRNRHPSLNIKKCLWEKIIINSKARSCCVAFLKLSELSTLSTKTVVHQNVFQHFSKGSKAPSNSEAIARVKGALNASSNCFSLLGEEPEAVAKTPRRPSWGHGRKVLAGSIQQWSVSPFDMRVFPKMVGFPNNHWFSY